MKKRLSIDFDGTIHKSSEGFKDGKLYDIPAEGSVFTLNNLTKEYEVVILTSRDSKDFPKIRRWLKKYGFPKMKITNRKSPSSAYIDNRAVRFISWADIAYYFL